MVHLNNMLFYKKLDDNSMKQFLYKIMSVLAGMTKREKLDRDTFDILQPNNAMTSRFYILPKIYVRIYWVDLVYCPAGPHENVSLYVDHHLSPLVKKIPS